MRSVQELLKQRVFREDMTQEEEIEFINHLFDKYENEGFSKVFCSPYDLDFGEGSLRNGEHFKVIGRVKPFLGDDADENKAEIECLPMWNIEFSDRCIMGAYAEEIIPSEIRDNMWRESDKKYLGEL